MNGVTIGAAIASRSEGALLRRCLSAAEGFDEIVLIDLESEDDSASIAAARGARVFAHKAVPYIELIRREQLALATTDWVLFLDPDEVLPSGWLDNARTMIAEAPEDVDGFFLNYRDIGFGRPLKHTRKGAAKLSLVRRTRARAPAGDKMRPHDALEVIGTARAAAEVLEAVDHYSYRAVAESIDKLSRYAKAGGVGVETESGPPSALTAIKMLWGSVIMSRSWRDGAPGVAVASMSAIGDYLGLLQRWDEAGRPDIAPTRSRTIALEAARLAHRAQWRLRQAAASKRR
jgi:hypothetical protein